MFDRQLTEFCAALTVTLAFAVGSVAAQAADGVDFAREVLPILSSHCWACHGPDADARQANLRLDQRDAALVPAASGRAAIVSGNAAGSELMARVFSTDPDVQMPPPAAKRPLSEGQRQTLQRWIEAGAPFTQHWAFTAPQRPAAPLVRQADWARNAIDLFVLARLEREGLSPSPPAERHVWLRRVTLDLTGLPPSLAELDDFLADDRAEARERVVDRLLASPHYAERMAMQWLDAARYADTNGYNNDETRTMWPWRDWTIDAFARGMPYDRFVTEQIAGDLLPNATLEQRVATGFNRNHVLTTEGGIVEEEYHVEYVADRVHATATAILGLSMQCARCHEHKYDPISQREYYRFAAYFDNVPDRIVGYNQARMAEPLLKVPSREQLAELDGLARQRDELTAWLAQRKAAADAGVAAWERSLAPEDRARPSDLGLVAHFSFDEPAGQEPADAVAGAPAAAVRGAAARVPGKFGGAFEFDGSAHVDAGGRGDFDGDQPFSISAWVHPTSNDPSTVLSKCDESNGFRGYDVILEGAKVAAHFSHRWPEDGFKVVTRESLPLGEWRHVLVVYDGSRTPAGVKIYVDGELKPQDVASGQSLEGTLETDKPLHLGRRQSSAPFRGKLDDVRLYSIELTGADAASLAAGQAPAGLGDVLATAPADRSESQRAALREHYLRHGDPEYPARSAELADIPRKAAEIEKAIPAVMIMQDAEPRRKTRVLRRGKYDQPGEEVSPGVPAALSPLPAEAPANRLGLAAWLTSPAHPLTARVAVNRWWEMLFGVGLVETVEDFGVQGSPPSHPELLDWLAVELIHNGWDQRALLKRMVLSATYCQASRATPESLERDPRNRLLGRGPRGRLPAETVRDNGLFVSGLLAERVGGPSVKPYQPDGLWEDVSVERRDKYAPDVGEGLYRRSMYTFWKRTCPPPGMAVFDAPDRETCVVRRARTNTPLQALALLNDPTFVEAARKLAERALLHAATKDERLTHVFRLAVSRPPAEGERQALGAVLRAAEDRFVREPAAAERLLGVGASPHDARCSPPELAAWTAVASIVLNMDETISKP